MAKLDNLTKYSKKTQKQPSVTILLVFFSLQPAILFLETIQVTNQLEVFATSPWHMLDIKLLSFVVDDE